MFITNENGGHRGTEQFARGKFLVVFSHNSSKAEEEANPLVLGPPIPMWRKPTWRKIDHEAICTCAGEPYYYQRTCPVHEVSYVKPNVDGRKLYAVVRTCILSQMGQFMMGTINIGGFHLTVSGAYGSDGLPTDYEKVPIDKRHHLIEIPQELADQFWAGGGHNSSGPEGPAMREYGRELLRQQNELKRKPKR